VFIPFFLSLVSSQPFLPTEHSLHSIFPPRYLASAIPAVLLVLLVVGALGYYGMVKAGQKAKKKQK